MLLLWIFSSIFIIVVNSEDYPIQIENKNINVLLNVDAKEIARELWKIIESHLKNSNGVSVTRRLLQENAVNELEQIIRRVIYPSRRLGPIAEFELANNYERIVRRALPILGWYESPFDPIANVDEIVDDMMWATKKLLIEPDQKKSAIKSHENTRSDSNFLTIMESLKNMANNFENYMFFSNGILGLPDTGDAIKGQHLKYPDEPGNNANLKSKLSDQPGMSDERSKNKNTYQSFDKQKNEESTDCGILIDKNVVNPSIELESTLRGTKINFNNEFEDFVSSPVSKIEKITK